jgi:hypothetical protein
LREDSKRSRRRWGSGGYEMAPGEFTKEETAAIEAAVSEILRAIPKEKALEFIRHLNDIFLLLGVAKKAEPSEKKLNGGGLQDGSR